MISSASLRRRALYGEPVSPPVTLNHHRIFVLPTHAGLLFGLMLIVMLLGAINYNNSLAHLLTFLLGSLGTVSLLHNYRNLAGLTISTAPTQPVFAGQPARFRLCLDNHDGPARYAVHLMLRVQNPVPRMPPLPHDVPADSPAWITLELPATRRGRLHSGPVTLSTRFPLGLFRAWTHLDLGLTCLVYPAPGLDADWQPFVSADASTAAGPASGPSGGTDDFVGLRSHAPGDSPRHIHWKAAARGQDLLTKRFAEASDDQAWLDWYSLPDHLDTEARLSALCRGILEAHAAGRPYGLRLPDREFSPAASDSHRLHCLEALALFGLADAP